jgi:hypothetical protein
VAHRPLISVPQTGELSGHEGARVNLGARNTYRFRIAAHRHERVFKTIFVVLMALSVTVALSEANDDRSTKECPAHVVRIAQFPNTDTNLHTWTRGELLAYDLLNRSRSVTPRFNDEKYSTLKRDLQSAESRLPNEFSDRTLNSFLLYEVLLIKVRFSESIQKEIRALALPPESTHVKAIPLPLQFSAGLSGLCEELCGCWFDVGAKGGGTINMYFGRGANLFYALRELRNMPGVLAAGLSRRQGGVDVSTMGVRVDDHAYYFTATHRDESGRLNSQFYKVKGEIAVPISSDEAATLSQFESPLLSDDLWFH